MATFSEAFAATDAEVERTFDSLCEGDNSEVTLVVDKHTIVHIVGSMHEHLRGVIQQAIFSPTTEEEAESLASHAACSLAALQATLAALQSCPDTPAGLQD